MAMQGQLSNSRLGTKYLLGELLGYGGFGEVYKAQNILLNRPQAIKVILEKHLSDPKFRERFLREAQTLAALNHPNIVHIDDFELEQERAYLVMPFISGGTLNSILVKAGPLPLDAVKHYLKQICAALDYAHARNVVHLDLKPRNLLHQNGILLLSDFGLAHLMKEGAVAGGPSLGFGSPLYMAPEQINGQPQARSDIYALGVILYQMLAGRPPFEGPTPEGVIFKQMTEPPPPLSTMRPDVPRALGLVVEKALAKKPEERYTTAGALLRDFSAALLPTALPPVRSDNGLNEAIRKSIQQMTTQSKEPDTIFSPPPPVSLPSNTRQELRPTDWPESGYGPDEVTFPHNRVQPSNISSSLPQNRQRFWPTLLKTLPLVALLIAGLLIGLRIVGVFAGHPQPSTVIITPTPTLTPTEQAKIVIQQYYGDINHQDYQAAWALLTPKFKNNSGDDFSTFSSGYKQDQRDDVAFDSITQNPDGSVTVITTLQVLKKDSAIKTYNWTACVVQQSDGSWKIDSAGFH